MNEDCGCCATTGAGVPAEVENRPGLSAIVYRAGTFAVFRKAILDRLAGTAELSGLTARTGEDFTITAVELWAAVADVLTFYAERTANEAFLRTALRRDSVLRLVRLLGYRPNPGAAPTTELAFTMEAGAKAVIPAGTRVQSVPAEGEKPQKYETSADISADGRLNRLRIVSAPRPAAPTGSGSSSAIAAPDAEAVRAAAGLSPGDRVMLYAPTATEVLTVRSVRAEADLVIVTWTEPIGSNAFREAYDAHDPGIRAHRIGRSFRLFGHDAPPTVVVAAQKNPEDATSGYLDLADIVHTVDTAKSLALDARYEGVKPGASVLAVHTSDTGLLAKPLQVTAVAQGVATLMAQPRRKKPDGTPADRITALSGSVTKLSLTGLSPSDADAVIPDLRNVTIYELVGEPLRFWPHRHPDVLSSPDVHLPGRRAGWSSIEVGRTITKGVAGGGTVIDLTDLPPGRRVLLSDDAGSAPVAATITDASLVGSGVGFGPTGSDRATVTALGLAPGQTTPLTALVSAPLAGLIGLPGDARRLVVTIGSLPARTIALALDPGEAVDSAVFALQHAIRAAMPEAPTFAHAVVHLLESPDARSFAIAVAAGVSGDRIAFGPSSDDATTVFTLRLDRAHARFVDGVLSAPLVPPPTSVKGDLRLTIGLAEKDITVSGTGLKEPADVAALLNGVAGIGAAARRDGRLAVFPSFPAPERREFLRLALRADAPFTMDTSTAVLLGNVVQASHGETVRGEVLGDGDAGRPFQRFTLKKKPLTYVPAATPGGVVSSLQLFVDGVRWTERPSLYGASPHDQIYVTQLADDGTVTVQLGDGDTGTRATTGRANVVARYRQGIGTQGRVQARRLQTLLDRPTGVKSVVNPAAADGGADPETLERAREAAPGTIRTFGRAVSLRDFEDTALTAGEIAKVAANWVWTGERRTVHLTVAAQGGATFSPDGIRRIVATLGTERDPNRSLVVDNYFPVAVLVDATLSVDPRHVAQVVLATARQALLHALSFEVRRFAQPVYLSDLVRILQNVDGVVAVDVNALDLKNRDPGFREEHGVDEKLTGPQPRLLMLPARPHRSEARILPAELAWVETPSLDVTLRTTGGLAS